MATHNIENDFDQSTSHAQAKRDEKKLTAQLLSSLEKLQAQIGLLSHKIDDHNNTLQHLVDRDFKTPALSSAQAKHAFQDTTVSTHGLEINSCLCQNSISTHSAYCRLANAHHVTKAKLAEAKLATVKWQKRATELEGQRSLVKHRKTARDDETDSVKQHESPYSVPSCYSVQETDLIGTASNRSAKRVRVQEWQSDRLNNPKDRENGIEKGSNHVTFSDRLPLYELSDSLDIGLDLYNQSSVMTTPRKVSRPPRTSDFSEKLKTRTNIKRVSKSVGTSFSGNEPVVAPASTLMQGSVPTCCYSIVQASPHIDPRDDADKTRNGLSQCGSNGVTMAQGEESESDKSEHPLNFNKFRLAKLLPDTEEIDIGTGMPRIAAAFDLDKADCSSVSSLKSPTATNTRTTKVGDGNSKHRTGTACGSQIQITSQKCREMTYSEDELARPASLIQTECDLHLGDEDETRQTPKIIHKDPVRSFRPEFTNILGRYRPTQERATTPPGFWLTEMASTQELQQQKDEMKGPANRK